MQIQQTSLDILDFIKLWFDLKSMASDTKEWGRPEFMENPPKAVRYQKLIALADGLGITMNVKALFSEDMDPINPSTRALGFLGNYRREYQTLNGFWNQFLEAPNEVGESYRRLAPVRKSLEGIGRKIDREIARYIPCERKSISLSVLVNEYGYPDVDLFDLDVEWM